MLPDELQHQQFVEICIEQRPRNRVELPIMIVRASGEIDDHKLLPFEKRGPALDKTQRSGYLFATGFDQRIRYLNRPVMLPLLDMTILSE